MPQSTGPSILLFKRFQTAWPNIDKQNYQVGMDDERVSSVMQHYLDDVYQFLYKVMNSEVQPRDDYRELLLLCLIFIDKIPREKVKFYKPGGFSRARWMSRAIYCLKMFLFRNEFHLTPTETKSVTELCIFIVLIYVKAWFTAPLAAASPDHDLRF